MALFVDAGSVSPEAVAALLDLLSDHGIVRVCRAYADWASPRMEEWVTGLRDHRLQSYHHVADDAEDQALLAMALDAVDLVHESAVDTIVVAGRLGAALPLVDRLHAIGARVVAASSGHTPRAVRAACDEFVDIDSLARHPRVPAGRHRA